MLGATLVEKSRVLVWGLASGLVVSLLGNLILAQRLMESQRLNYDLSSARDELRQSYDDLLQSYEELEETYTPEPPISKDQAIDIALDRYGQWNETSLEGMKVTASLGYYLFRKSPREFQFLHEVIAHVSDYGPDDRSIWSGTCGEGEDIILIPLGRDCITFRYCWFVIIVPEYLDVPAPAYWIDASTGEVVSET